MNINFVKEQFEIAKKASFLSETIVVDVKTMEWMIWEIERLRKRNSRYADKIIKLKEQNKYLKLKFSTAHFEEKAKEDIKGYPLLCELSK